MAFWDFFKKKGEIKKKEKMIKPKNDWTILGPAYLDGLTIEVASQKELMPFEWKGQLKSPSGETKFSIKFYGQLHEDFNELIVMTDAVPALVYAVGASTKEEILIFDGCKHGYNAIFCDNFEKEQLEGRKANNFYTDKDGNDIFEIIISAYYQIDYDDENEDFIENVDANGLIELNDGNQVDFETVKRNGFDFLQILLITTEGKSIEILSEELS